MSELPELSPKVIDPVYSIIALGAWRFIPHPDPVHEAFFYFRRHQTGQGVMDCDKFWVQADNERLQRNKRQQISLETRGVRMDADLGAIVSSIGVRLPDDDPACLRCSFSVRNVGKVSLRDCSIGFRLGFVCAPAAAPDVCNVTSWPDLECSLLSSHTEVTKLGYSLDGDLLEMSSCVEWHTFNTSSQLRVAGPPTCLGPGQTLEVSATVRQAPIDEQDDDHALH